MDPTPPYGPAFVGKRAEELSSAIEQQLEPVFRAREISIPVRSCSLLYALRSRGAATASELAKDLGQSHQLVLQKTPALEAENLIRRRPDRKDRRRRVFHLTAEARRQLGRLDELMPALERVYADLDAEVGVALFVSLGRALAALRSRTIGNRLEGAD